MAAALAPERTLTQTDYVRLTRLLTEQPDALHAPVLEELLALSDLVASPAVPPDVVTMDSQVLYADGATGERRKIALCYPADADPAAGRVSVLAPLGTALLGLRVGDMAHWSGPQGAAHAGRVAEMLFQPEASGDYTT